RVDAQHAVFWEQHAYINQQLSTLQRDFVQFPSTEALQREIGNSVERESLRLAEKLVRLEQQFSTVRQEIEAQLSPYLRTLNSLDAQVEANTVNLDGLKQSIVAQLESLHIRIRRTERLHHDEFTTSVN